MCVPNVVDVSVSDRECVWGSLDKLTDDVQLPCGLQKQTGDVGILGTARNRFAIVLR